MSNTWRARKRDVPRSEAEATLLEGQMNPIHVAGARWPSPEGQQGNCGTRDRCVDYLNV
jgi:hypothetical protein